MPAGARLRVIHHPEELALLLTSPGGGVVKDLHRRCLNVQNQAKRNLERAPRRVDTGTLRSDIHIQLLTGSGNPPTPIGRVGFNVFYGIYVHDGTGIEGPRGTYIRPRQARFLRWKNKRGRYVYARKVAGMAPNPFLKDALSAAKG